MGQNLVFVAALEYREASSAARPGGLGRNAADLFVSPRGQQLYRKVFQSHDMRACPVNGFAFSV